MGKVLVVCFFLFGVAVASDSRKTTKKVDFYWRDYDGTIPSDALPTGHGLYIAQIIENKNCGNIPATLYPDTQTAVSMANGKKITATSNIKILCTKEPKRFSWQYVNIASVQGDALNSYQLGGSEVGTNLYIGRLLHENQWKYGKVFPATSRWRGLNLWTNKGGQYVAYDFEILIFN